MGVRLRGTKRGVAATTDCNGRYCFLDPREGAKAAVAEAARNLACVGALPLAVTNNLNFGNPLKLPIYYQLREAVLGMAEACSFFETPVTGGNVSLYNETGGKAIYPTPVIGMVGVFEDVSLALGSRFQDEGDAIILLGESRAELGGSEYLYRTEGIVAGAPPKVDLHHERQLQRALLALANERAIRSAHDCSEGGLACALAESAMGNLKGARGIDVELDDSLPPVAAFFGETQGRVVVSCEPEMVDRVLGIAQEYDVPAQRIGTVGGPSGFFNLRTSRGSIRVEADRVARIHREALPTLMETPAG
jgi:phosphoribosylformylglycinamidine synthase